MSGDVSMKSCGMSEEDRDLVCEEVQFVIHSAASTSFNDHIRDAMANNYWVRYLKSRSARSIANR